MPPNAQEPVLTRPFLLLVSAQFLQAFGWSSMLLLPLYLDHLGASRAEIGSLMAISSIGGLLSRPLVGWALDVVGRKPTLIAGTLVLFVGMLLVGTVVEVGPLAYGMRIVFGIGGGALFTGYFTFAADLVPESRRTEGLALFGISGLLPLLLNPFADRIGIAPADVRWFLPVVGGSVLLSLPLLLAVPDVDRGVRSPERVTLRSAWSALSAERLAPVWVATGLFAGLVAVFMSFATVTAADRATAHPSTVWLTYAFGAIGVRLLGAQLPDRVGPSKIAAAALLSYAGGLWVAASAQSDLGFGVAGALAGFGHGYCFPVLSAQVVGRSPAALRGIAMATFTGLWALARLVVAPAFGWGSDQSTDELMLQLASGTALLGLGVWLALEIRFGAPPRPTADPGASGLG